MHIIFKLALHGEQLNIYLIKSQYKCFSVENTFCGDRCMGRGVLRSMLFLKDYEANKSDKTQGSHKNRSLLMKNLIYFCFNWTHWASSVNLHHTVYFGNKPKACKEANCSCKKKEDQNHYHGITKVQNCTCCSCDLQF